MLITYYTNGQPYIVENRINGKRNGTVYIYNVSGQLINNFKYKNCQIYSIEYQQNGFTHNEHGPAYMSWFDVQIHSISYYQNDNLHNLHGPAFMGFYNDKIYCIQFYQNSIGHNLHGPAFMHWSNGQIYSIDFYHFGKLIKEYEF